MRNVALMILVIPAVIAAIGIKLMRDTFFGISDGFPYLWMQFGVGLIIFVLGIAFIAGFFFYREQKKNEGRKDCRKKHNKA